MNDDAGEPVTVDIFGEEYAIRSEKGAEHTRACAEHVDEAIQSAHLKSHVSEPHKAAILAALEITDELFRVRSERDDLRRDLARRAARLRDTVEEALEDRSDPAAG